MQGLNHLIERFEWLYQNDADKIRTGSARQELARLKEAVHAACDALDAERLTEYQQALEDALFHLLPALRLMGIAPDEGLRRAWLRTRASAEEKAFHVFGDRLEVRVGEETRGTWPLFTQEDYQALVSMARELGCPVVHHDTRQLELF